MILYKRIYNTRFILLAFIAAAILIGLYSKNTSKENSPVNEMALLDKALESFNNEGKLVVSIKNPEFENYSFIISKEHGKHSDLAEKHLKEQEKKIKAISPNAYISNASIKDTSSDFSQNTEDIEDLIKKVVLFYAKDKNIGFNIENLDYTLEIADD